MEISEYLRGSVSLVAQLPRRLSCVRACACRKVCYERRTITGTQILRLISLCRTAIPWLRNERIEDGIIMDYPVLGHYDPSVEATADSGGDEQELHCEYISYLLLTFFLFVLRRRQTNSPLRPNAFIIHRRFEDTERRETSFLFHDTRCSKRDARSGVPLSVSIAYLLSHL